MFRAFAIVSLATLACAVSSAVLQPRPAQAQFGPLFSDEPLRPPGGIPRGPSSPDDEEEVPELPRGRLLPTPNRPLPGQSARPPGTYQSQPLPPPPGTTVIPQNSPLPPSATTAPTAIVPAPTAPPPPGVATAPAAPAARQSRTAPPLPPTLQPGDEVVSEPRAQKIVNRKATFSGLDKITGRIIAFDADIGETVQFGALRVKPDACYTRSATEAANTDAFVEVDEITLQGEVKRIFSGWMFAASPGLHGVEHPIYDIWLIDCKSPDATVVAVQPDPPKVAPPPQKRAPPKQPRPAPPPAQFNAFPPFGR